jgi:hypothetical protein
MPPRPTTQLRTYNCPNCAAPLNLVPNADTLTCAYCHNTIQVRRPNAPPPAMPVEQRFVLHVPHDFNADFQAAARVSNMVGVIVTLVVVVAAVLPGVFIALRSSGFRLTSTSLPAECAMNEKITIDGQTYTKGGVALTADLNCKVLIKHSKIKGKIEMKTNAEVTFEDTEITGDDELIDVGINGKLKMTNTKIHSDGVAITTTDNADITFIDSEIVSKGAGIHAATNFVASLKNTKLTSEELGIAADSNSKITLDATSEISGTDFGVKLGVNPEVNCKGKITSEQVGISADTNAKLSIGKTCVVSGKNNAIVGNINFNLTLDGKLVSEQVAMNAHSVQSLQISGGAVIDAPMPWPFGFTAHASSVNVSPRATIPGLSASASASGSSSKHTCTSSEIAAGKPGCH